MPETKIVPNCRYGHGDLNMVTFESAHPIWGFVSGKNPAIIFSGNLFTCSTCGYTEMFDNDPHVTKQQETGAAMQTLGDWSAK